MKRLLLLITILAALPVYADCVLQADTADTGFAIGPFFDSTDGVTRETALTITSAEVILKKKGSTTFAAKNDATACTHRDSGWYTCPLDATDTNTEGNLIVEVEEAGSTGAWRECLVVASDYYDLLDGTESLMNSRQAGNKLDTTVSSVTSQTVFVLTAGATNDDAYNGLIADLDGNAGGEDCEREVTDYVGSSKTLTIESACSSFTVAATDDIRIHVGGAGTTESATNSLASGIDTKADDILIDTSTTIQDILDVLVVTTGTADSGTTTTMVDAARTEADDDYWQKGVAIHFTSGNLAGQSACVYDFVASSDTMTFRPALTQAVTTHTYALMSSPTCGGVVAP